MLESDTTWLAKQHLMDYSLLLGWPFCLSFVNWARALNVNVYVVYAIVGYHFISIAIVSDYSDYPMIDY